MKARHVPTPPQVKALEPVHCELCQSSNIVAKWAAQGFWDEECKAVDVFCGQCGHEVERIKVIRRGNDYERCDPSKIVQVLQPV